MGYCYLATNKINEKCYIGFTSKTLTHRKKKHLQDTYYNTTNGVFHKALRKYGNDAFYWQIIYENKDIEQLKKREIMLIDLYSSHISKHGYNMTIGGEGNIGFKHSEESKLKMSESAKGRIIPKEQRLKISESSKGKKISEETRRKLSIAKSNPSKEIRNKISIANKGKKHSKKAIKNMCVPLRLAKGYRYDKNKNKYIASITINRKRKMKTFKTEQEAIEQRRLWIEEYHLCSTDAI